MREELGIAGFLFTIENSESPDTVESRLYGYWARKALILEEL